MTDVLIRTRKFENRNTDTQGGDVKMETEIAVLICKPTNAKNC